MRGAIIGVAALALSSTVLAEDRVVAEVWECADHSDGAWRTILLSATVNQNRTTGQIVAAGTTQWAAFEVAGIERRWDFSLDDEGYFNYTLVISPNGDGRYYDFSKARKGRPSIVMKCRQK